MNQETPIQQTPLTQIARLQNGAIIIGKTSLDENKYVIEDPYTVIPGADGLQMFPFDKDLLGVTLEKMSIDQSQVMYSQEPHQDIANTYLTNLSGIEIEAPKSLIL